MKRQKSKKTKAKPDDGDFRRSPPFTRLSSHTVVTTDDFERERMGLAAKE
jgi:hypothetical protein